jgi:serine/threonine protein kinase
MDREYIGRYHVIAQLGRGGMGTVLQAMDEMKHRQVAIKLPNDLEPGSITRLKQECDLLTQLEHHHIVQVYGSGSEPDLPFYIVMEYVEGQTVEALLRQQPGRRLEPRRALKIALGVAEALAYAHRRPQRVIHRDIKPANVLIRTSDDAVKVTDFGIAAVLAERTGRTAVGTLAYMAPEQATGQGVDGRADLYSLAAMLYEMLTGERTPQLASSPARLPSSLPGVATMPVQMMQRVDRLVIGLLERDPNQRVYQRADEVVEELQAILQGRPTRELPRSRSHAGSQPVPHKPASPGSQPPNPAPLPPRSGAYPPAPRPSYPPRPGYPPPRPSSPPLPSSSPYPPYPPPQPVVVNVVPQPVQVVPVMPVVPVIPVVPVVPIYVQPISGKASAALTLGILSWCIGWILTAIPAVICGHMALSEINASNGQLGGHGRAVAGLVLGYIMIGLTLFFCLIALANAH